ncbi:MAG: hypothetical protein OEV81_04610 [Betaproteobacteria bacterium]|nr:hypothetical protein [Betaproteobacteria bacterium]MDH5222625.1 hypothetical protein [Betaproteobacteria bacterium]MDH5351872.1 hypothetical protein [Betaproteobacteria bacterium]
MDAQRLGTADVRTLIVGSTEKNACGTYTRIVNGVPAFRWLKVTPGKDF